MSDRMDIEGSNPLNESSSNELKSLYERLDRIERDLDKSLPNDPALMATRTQNWLTLVLVIIAIVGVPAIYNSNALGKVEERVERDLDSIIATRQAMVAEVSEFIDASERKIDDRLSLVVQDQKERSAQFEELFNQKFSLLEEDMKSYVGQEVGVRSLSIQYKLVDDRQNSKTPRVYKGTAYCRQSIGFLVKNETDYVAEVIAEELLMPYPFAYAGEGSAIDRWYDSIYNDVSSYSERFIVGFGERIWPDSVDVSQEHAESIMRMMSVNGYSPVFGYVLSYKSPGGKSKSVNLEFEIEFDQEFLACLEILSDPNYVVEEVGAPSDQQ